MTQSFWVALRNSGLKILGVASLFAATMPGTSTAQGDGLTIGFLLKTMQEARYQTDKSLFIARAESMGAKVVFDSSGNDPLRQLQQVEEMLEDGIDVLVLQPVNTGTAGALVDLAHDVGVKVIGYDSMLQDGPLDVMVMQDSWMVGRLQGEALVGWLQQTKGEVSGHVALIRGQPGDSNAEALSSGVLDVIDSYPALELIADRSHVDWSPELARETATTLLVEYDNQIDAFVANNSGMAFGVIAALRDEDLAGADKVFVAGSDADLRNIRLVAQDIQVMDVWKQIKPLAFAAADLAIKIGNAPDTEISDLVGEHALINNGYADIPTVITPVVAISKDSIEDTLVADGFYTAEQVYNE